MSDMMIIDETDTPPDIDRDAVQKWYEAQLELPEHERWAELPPIGTIF